MEYIDVVNEETQLNAKLNYTNLLKLLNFPEEFYVSANYGNEKGMYKLIGNSYVFYLLDKYSNQWYSVVESYKKFKGKNWR